MKIQIKSATEAPFQSAINATGATLAKNTRAAQKVAEKQFNKGYKQDLKDAEKSFKLKQTFSPKEGSFNLHATSEQERNVEFARQLGSNKEEYIIKTILNHPKNKLDPFFVEDVAKKLVTSREPFSTKLFKDIELLQNNGIQVSDLAGKYLLAYADDLYDYFSKYGTVGLGEDDFQFKAISYFSKKNADPSVLLTKSKNAWLNADEMKENISAMSDEEQSALKSRRTSKQTKDKKKKLEEMRQIMDAYPKNSMVKMIQEKSKTDEDKLEYYDGLMELYARMEKDHAKLL